MNSVKVSFIGGGKRMLYCAEELGCREIECALYGFDTLNAGSVCTRCTSLDGCLGNTSAVILPVPLSKDGMTLYGTNIFLSDVFKRAPGEALFFAGAVSDKARSLAKEYSIEIKDLLDDECLTEKNAYSTAEGAIMLVMQNSEKTVRDNRFLVCGYGRIGSYTSRLLKNFGADVTVYARREISRVKAESEGLKSIAPGELKDNVGKYDFIINTVPSNIFTETELSEMSSEQIYIELASAPYGIDRKLMQKYNTETVNGSSLPSKYCPRSAGRDIAKVLYTEFKKGGIV